MKQTMTKTGRRIVLLLAALAAACSSGDPVPTAGNAAGNQAASDAGTQVTGTLSYRERMLLKPGSIVEVWLLDTSLADVAATEIAYQRIENPGQQPVHYALDYDPADIRENMQYSVRAQVTHNDTLLFTTDTHYPALTRGAGNRVDLVLVRVASAPEARAETMKPDASLTNTYWKLTSIQGVPYTHSGEQREPHLKLVTQNLVASGRGGCNAFTGSYETYAGSLRFGMLAVTQMACIDAMDTEARFLKALERVDQFDIVGDTLVLSAGAEALLGFDAIYF